MFKINLLHVDTEKYARAFKNKLFTEKERNDAEGYIIIETEQNKVFMKNKLGISDEKHITEVTSGGMTGRKVENLSEKGSSEKLAQVQDVQPEAQEQPVDQPEAHASKPHASNSGTPSDGKTANSSDPEDFTRDSSDKGKKAHETFSNKQFMNPDHGFGYQRGNMYDRQYQSGGYRTTDPANRATKGMSSGPSREVLIVESQKLSNAYQEDLEITSFQNISDKNVK